MSEAVARWREFEKSLHSKGLAWALEYAPADLRWARSADHPHGARVEHLLPVDYLAFVAEAGYPVLGFDYYDRKGMSFLPPDPMAVLSTTVYDDDHGFPTGTGSGPTVCRHAFFAGYDLSDVSGYALAEDGVWLIEGSAVVEHMGSFTEWLPSALGELERRIAEPGCGEGVAPGRAADPHRLFDYSLESGAADRLPYSTPDLELSWVEDQSGTSYAYGLIDAGGRWRIPMGERFLGVRPFRDGVAEVIENAGDSSYSGPWTRIDTEGRAL
ncbi:hypothetical protein [Streptomyces sp. NPDC001880]